jgi:hypothetical protein
MTITRNGLRRLAGFLVFALAISILVMRSGFFSPDFAVSNDTPSYVNLPGLDAGLSISNFGSRFRPPGFGLFLGASTFGGLPRDKAMVHVDCGDSVLSQDPACDQTPKDRNDIVLRTGQAIFIVPAETARQFRQVVTSAKLLLIASFVALYFAMTIWLDPLLSATVCAVLWYWTVPTGQSEFDVIMTECLFPSLLLFYGAIAMKSLSSRSVVWPLLSSVLVFYIFLVKPSLGYLFAIQFDLLLVWAGCRGSLRMAIVASMPLLIGFCWFFLFSPNIYLKRAQTESKALRVAILSDEKTVACIPDEESRIIIRAYIHSAYSMAGLSASDNLHNDVQRYVSLGEANVYRLVLLKHPIYSDPTIKPFLESRGRLRADITNRAMQEATTCNRARDLKFAILISQAVFGLLPSPSPIISQRFFFAPYIFWLSIAILFGALFITFLRGDINRSAIIIGAVTIHVLYVVVVAFKQGGESRYIFATEPVFALGFLFAAAFLVESIIRFVTDSFGRLSRTI